MPQWDFLNFLAGRAKAFPAFDLRMQHEVAGLIIEGGQVKGVEARTTHGQSYRFAQIWWWAATAATRPRAMPRNWK